MKSVLVATIHAEVVSGLRQCLGAEYKILTASDLPECMELFQRKRAQFTFLDLDLLRREGDPPGTPEEYKGKLQPFLKVSPHASILVVCPVNRIREAVSAVKGGAGDYLTYPFETTEVHQVMEGLSHLLRIESELQVLRNGLLESRLSPETQTHSPLMREILNKIASVAPTKTTVLLLGETGTGKGVMARVIHQWSNRANNPFVPVHCGSIPDTLLESELFGHEKGAFTGALRRKLGKFQLAHEGTIFLDELSTISASSQVKLLQVLQERSFSMVGGDTMISVDVRIVGATNVDLHKMCEEGSFRRDLYYRLNVFPLELPSLRNRLEDLPLLIQAFLERLNRTYGKGIEDVDGEVLEAFEHYSWPGNIRELENLIERAYIIERGRLLTPPSFPTELFTMKPVDGRQGASSMPNLAHVRLRALEQAETRYLQEVLALTKGRIDRSAIMAGITTRQLHNLLTKYGLHKENFKQPHGSHQKNAFPTISEKT